MSVLPQLSCSTTGFPHLPPAAPSSLFTVEEDSFSFSGTSAASCEQSSKVSCINAVEEEQKKHDKKTDTKRNNTTKKVEAATAAKARLHAGMRAAEETLQWLAACVLQGEPPPHMLPLEEVFEKIFCLDAVGASQALLHITRNIAKVFQASRLLFVGSLEACKQRVSERRRLEEQSQEVAAVVDQQQQQQRQREDVRHANKENSHSDSEWEHQEKTEKRWGGEEAEEKTVATSWEDEVNEEEEEAYGSHKGKRDIVLEKSVDEDADDWSQVPVRNEESSCFPWLLPNRKTTSDGIATLYAGTEEDIYSSCTSRGDPEKKHGGEGDGDIRSGVDSIKKDDEVDLVDNLFVLLQPVSPAEEAFGCRDVLIRLCHFLSVQDVINVGRICRATVGASLSEDVWMPLLQRTFPKASLVNEDTLENAEEMQRIDNAKHQQIVDDMLVKFPPDKPVSLPALLLSANKTLNSDAAVSASGSTTASAGELRLRMDAEALLHLLSCHADTFKQDASGQQFVVQPSRLYSDWLPVNPYVVANWGPERHRQLQDETQRLWREEQCEAGALSDSHQQQLQDAEKTISQRISAKEDGQTDAAGQLQLCAGMNLWNVIFRRDLSARQAFRLWHTKLLGAEQNRERPWEYFNACSEISSTTKSLVHKRGLLLPAGALLDLCERRLQFVRLEDPLTVHTLVLRTLDGIMYHIPSGCFNRRVNLLQQALCSPHLRLERETRKRIERRLLDFMQHVRDERKFGFFACRTCGSRWRSGFTYDEIAQQCLRCGLWNKAFKCQPLRAVAGQGLPTAAASSSNSLSVPHAQQPHRHQQTADGLLPHPPLPPATPVPHHHHQQQQNPRALHPKHRDEAPAAPVVSAQNSQQQRSPYSSPQQNLHYQHHRGRRQHQKQQQSRGDHLPMQEPLQLPRQQQQQHQLESALTVNQHNRLFSRGGVVTQRHQQSRLQYDYTEQNQQHPHSCKDLLQHSLYSEVPQYTQQSLVNSSFYQRRPPRQERRSFRTRGIGNVDRHRTVAGEESKREYFTSEDAQQSLPSYAAENVSFFRQSQKNRPMNGPLFIREKEDQRAKSATFAEAPPSSLPYADKQNLSLRQIDTRCQTNGPPSIGQGTEELNQDECRSTGEDGRPRGGTRQNKKMESRPNCVQKGRDIIDEWQQHCMPSHASENRQSEDLPFPNSGSHDQQCQKGVPKSIIDGFSKPKADGSGGGGGPRGNRSFRVPKTPLLRDNQHVQPQEGGRSSKEDPWGRLFSSSKEDNPLPSVRQKLSQQQCKSHDVLHVRNESLQISQRRTRERPSRKGCAVREEVSEDLRRGSTHDSRSELVRRVLHRQLQLVTGGTSAGRSQQEILPIVSNCGDCDSQGKFG